MGSHGTRIKIGTKCEYMPSYSRLVALSWREHVLETESNELYAHAHVIFTLQIGLREYLSVYFNSPG